MLRALSLAMFLACWEIGSLFAGPRNLPAPFDVLRRLTIEAESGALIFNLGGLPNSKWFLFDLGVACPNGTRSSEIRVGGSRTCELSTGDMPETIAALEPLR